MKQLLKTYFGYDGFRPLQEEVIKKPLKNAVFVIPAEAGIQDLRQKINYKREIY